jgi:hypothetical protein
MFRRDDGSGGLIACVEPGHMAMVALTDLPDDLPIDELAAAVYQLTYFDRSILPFELIQVQSLEVTDIEVVRQGSGSAFTGTLANGLEVPMIDAAVTIFALNAVGRPLGRAVTAPGTDVAAGERWTFETSTVADPGTDWVAFPSGSVSF